MNWSTGLSWAATIRRLRDAQSDDDDRGDMGTAFGLDASLASREDESGAEAAPPAPSSLPWEHRLTRRSGL